MLKELISLFADSFIKNKSEWVGGQGYPSSDKITVTRNSGAWGEYTAPHDGYFYFNPGNNSAASVNNCSIYTDNGTGIRVSAIATSHTCFFIPVRKGQKVSYYFRYTDTSKTGSENFYFSKSLGSS